MVDRIREILSARQLTPTQFADTIGVARPIVSHILSGRNKPSLEVVQKIVDAFPDVSLTWLMKGVGSMNATESAPTASALTSIPTATKRPNLKTPEITRPARSRQQVAQQPAKPTTAPTAIVSEVNSRSIDLNSIKQEVILPEPLPVGPVVATISEPHEIASRDAEPTAPTAPIAAPTSVGGNYTSGKTADAIASASTLETRNGNDSGSSVPSVAQPFLKADKAIRRIVIFYQDGTFTDYQPENA